MLAGMSRTFDLHRLKEAAATALADHEEVAAAYAYGSRVSGRPLPGSDLDIAVVTTRTGAESDPLLAERLAGRLAEALGGAVEIDCRLADALPLALIGRIVTEGVLVHDGSPELRVAFETDTRRLYFDFLPFIERDARDGLLAGG
jgi:predicted nucleotidyltransferase